MVGRRLDVPGLHPVFSTGLLLVSLLPFWGGVILAAVGGTTAAANNRSKAWSFSKLGVGAGSAVVSDADDPLPKSQRSSPG